VTTHAKGTFENKGWDENDVEVLDEGKITRASVQQSFSGDLAGDGNIDWVMYYRPDGTASYVGVYRIAGTLGERSGTVVIETTGAFEDGVARGDWRVLGGTGELAGVRGTGRFEAPTGPNGSYELDYEL
jgi:hypothetical protein